jgi:hypothetical protein
LQEVGDLPLMHEEEDAAAFPVSQWAMTTEAPAAAPAAMGKALVKERCFTGGAGASSCKV